MLDALDAGDTNVGQFAGSASPHSEQAVTMILEGYWYAVLKERFPVQKVKEFPGHKEPVQFVAFPAPSGRFPAVRRLLA